MEIGFVLQKSLCGLSLFCPKSPNLPLSHISVRCLLSPASCLLYTISILFNLVTYLSYTVRAGRQVNSRQKGEPEKGLRVARTASRSPFHVTTLVA
jgi:hypothetical protein